MAKKIDKTRAETEGLVTFIGTGVGVETEVTREDDDLTEKIRAIVAAMLSNQGTENEELIGETTQDVNTFILQKNEEIWNELTQIWNTINNLESGTGSGVNVYKRVSDHGDAGKYNCYLQEWVAGAWANVDTNTIVVKNVYETTGHAFEGTVYFHSIGPETQPVPVMPIRADVFCRAFSGSSQFNIDRTQPVLVELDTTVFGSQDLDLQSMFDAGTHKTTVPLAGTYEITSQIFWGNIEDLALHYHYLYKNGVAASLVKDVIRTSIDNNVGYTRVTSTINLEANDYLQLYCWALSTADTVDIIADYAETWMSVHLIKLK